MRDRIQNRQPNNRRHAQSRQERRLHFPVRRRERPSQRRDDLHRPERHVEQDRLEARKAEAAHDQGPESRYPAARNRDCCQQGCPNPGLGVEEAFPDVVPAPCARGDSLLVHAQAFDRYEFFRGGEEARLHGGVGEPDVDYGGEKH